jgi:hypothetical protein
MLHVVALSTDTVWLRAETALDPGQTVSP